MHRNRNETDSHYSSLTGTLSLAVIAMELASLFLVAPLSLALRPATTMWSAVTSALGGKAQKAALCPEAKSRCERGWPCDLIITNLNSGRFVLL